MKLRSYSLLVGTVVVASFACKPKQEQLQTSAPSDTNNLKSVTALEKTWESVDDLLTPESVLYDAQNQQYFVSCIAGVPPTAIDGDGYISILNLDGTTKAARWSTGLNAPKGMAITKDHLVVTDITNLVFIDLTTGKVTESIPVEGAQFLNDVDIDESGTIYFTDSNTGTLYQYKDKAISMVSNDPVIAGSNGVHAEDGAAVLASFATGDIMTVDLSTGAAKKVGSGIPGGDGVRPYGEGYLISNWNGEVYYVDGNWQPTKLLDTKAEKVNAADIEVNRDANLLLVPTFFDNKVVAYKIK